MQYGIYVGGRREIDETVMRLCVEGGHESLREITIPSSLED